MNLEGVGALLWETKLAKTSLKLAPFETLPSWTVKAAGAGR